MHIYSRPLETRGSDGTKSWGKTQSYPLDWDGSPVFDLHVLGVIPASPIGLGKLLLRKDSVLGQTQLQRTAFERVMLNGDEVVRIEMKNGDSISRTVWIDDTKGPSVVRVRYRAHYKGQLVEELMQVELQQVGDNWFPAQLATQRYTGGFPIPKEFVTISNVRLNEEIDDNLFDLEQLPPPTDR
ncbi:MAG: hypothetical protein KDA69_14510 [Planctomycetaceae bacterium]|nr:hypothetical protein [Planctomycetaceae bacterium]